MPFFYMDYWYLILVVPTIVIALFAQIKVKSSFNKFSCVNSSVGMTAADVTRRILDSNGLRHVSIQRVRGNLTDHYDPRANVIRLSDSVYDSTSIAAIGVAAHEAGHAVQYASNYAPIKIRNSIIPVANLGSTIAPLIIILGIVFSMPSITWIGILLYSSIAVFQLVTLPVEFNASGRALKTLSQMNILNSNEIGGAKEVLSAAAMTYVAALLTTLANLLRFVMISRRNDR